MSAPTILLLAALAQGAVTLEVEKPMEGVIGADSPVVHTATLDSSYTNAPTVGIDYQVMMANSGPVTIRLRSYDFDAYLVITDTNGAVLAENDDGPIGTHSLVVLNLEAESKYTVRACALHGEVGSFELQLSDGVPARPTREEWMAAVEEDFRAGLIRIEQTLGRESEKYARLQEYLGHHYMRQGAYQQAQAQLEISLEIRESVHGPESPYTAESLNSLGLLFHNQGKYDDARALYERALAISEAAFGPDHPLTARGLNNLASLFQVQGNYEEAKAIFQRVLTIVEKSLGPEHPDTARCINNLAVLLEAQGNYEFARPLFERSLAIREKVLGPDHPVTATSLNNLAFLFNSQGNYEEARPLYERALAIREQMAGPNHPDTANSLTNLAILLRSQGNFEEASPLYERALAINERAFGPQHPATASALTNLASLLRNQGNYERAKPLYERGLAIFERVFGPEHLETARCLNNLAVLLEEQGDLEEARPLFERSLAIREKLLGSNHPVTATSLNNLAFLLNSQGNFEQARPLYKRSLSALEQALGPEHPNVFRILDSLAVLHGLQGKYQEAVPYLQESLSRSLSYLDRELPSMSEAGRFRLLEVSANPERLIYGVSRMAEADSEKAYSLFLEWKGKATRLQSASVKLGQTNDAQLVRELKGNIQVLAKELSGLILVPLAEQAPDHAARIDSLRQKRLRLERQLNRELGLDLVMASPGLAAVQKSLPEDSVLIDFFVGRDVYAWLVQATEDVRLIPLGNANDLREAQNAFLREGALRGGQSLSRSQSNSAADYLALLWEPLRMAVADSKTVFISPDGFLCELPFGILQEADESFLLEKHRFVYLSDPTSLAANQSSRQSDEGTLLAVGGVNYFRREEVSVSNASGLSTRSRVGDSWSSLPATRDEMQTLRDLHEYILEWESPMTLVEGKAATEERIRAELPGKRYVHIATHGYFEPEHLPSLLLDAEEKQAEARFEEQIQAVGLLPGLLSGLVFAGVNGDPDPARDDGYLSAEEIQHLDLSACDLVVLSACETALGSARAGEGLMSLRRSFAVAGADTVISSLWRVDDQATAQLMKEFYSNLWEKGMSRGEALHQAKLRMLRRNRIDNSGDARPSTWGAFVLSGAWN